MEGSGAAMAISTVSEALRIPCSWSLSLVRAASVEVSCREYARAELHLWIFVYSGESLRGTDYVEKQRLRAGIRRRYIYNLRNCSALARRPAVGRDPERIHRARHRELDGFRLRLAMCR